MMIYYVMLRGVDKFQAEYNSYPGEFDDQVEPDIVKLKVLSSFYTYNNYHVTIVLHCSDCITDMSHETVKRMGMRPISQRRLRARALPIRRRRIAFCFGISGWACGAGSHQAHHEPI